METDMHTKADNTAGLFAVQSLPPIDGGAVAGFVPLAPPPLARGHLPALAGNPKSIADLLAFADKIGIADAVEVLRENYELRQRGAPGAAHGTPAA